MSLRNSEAQGEDRRLSGGPLCLPVDRAEMTAGLPVVKTSLACRLVGPNQWARTILHTCDGDSVLGADVPLLANAFFSSCRVHCFPMRVAPVVASSIAGLFLPGVCGRKAGQRGTRQNFSTVQVRLHFTLACDIRCAVQQRSTEPRGA